MIITKEIADAANKAGACYKIREGVDADSVKLRDIAWAASKLPAQIVRRHTEYACERGVRVEIVGRQRKITCHSPDGESVASHWRNGKLHRPASDGPAYVHFYASGAKLVEYYENDKRHRPASDGPASVHTSTDGAKVVKFYENGERVCPNE